MRYIFVSGGVVSGIGKGITSAAIGLILKDKGIRVTNVKIDMYLNVDAGTIRPQEHGEVFVTDDGLETDQDLGNYERFLNVSLKRENYMTTGQVYRSVIERERAFGYQGEDVEAIPHVTDEILGRIESAGKKNKAQIAIVELGGTVGEYQNALFFEASRILRLRNPGKVLQIHVTYLPVIKNVGELKSKPAQQSVHLLNAMGIQPDFLIARSEKEIDQKRKEKLALFCNLSPEEIIGNPDLANAYEVPLNLDRQKLGERILKKFRMRAKQSRELIKWQKFVNLGGNVKGKVRVAMVGKYFATGDYKLSDSYISVIEALKQVAAYQGVGLEMEWFDSEELEKGKVNLEGYSGLLVPQGWGKRGVEGKIKAIKWARENKLPYLGLCFGMQMAVIEFARNVLHLNQANSTEVNPKTNHPVIHIMPEQLEYLKKKQYGGTIRLGSWPCVLKKGFLLWKAYEKYGKEKDYPWRFEDGVIHERHRHRYEFNSEYRERFEKKGLIISGESPDGQLVEAIELVNHPFFVGVQFHPEYIARPLSPHPIFLSFVEAMKD